MVQSGFLVQGLQAGFLHQKSGTRGGGKDKCRTRKENPPPGEVTYTVSEYWSRLLGQARDHRVYPLGLRV